MPRDAGAVSEASLAWKKHSHDGAGAESDGSHGDRSSTCISPAHGCSCSSFFASSSMAASGGGSNRSRSGVQGSGARGQMVPVLSSGGCARAGPDAMTIGLGGVAGGRHAASDHRFQPGDFTISPLIRIDTINRDPIFYRKSPNSDRDYKIGGYMKNIPHRDFAKKKVLRTLQTSPLSSIPAGGRRLPYSGHRPALALGYIHHPIRS